jgi:hypothetical protein
MRSFVCSLALATLLFGVEAAVGLRFGDSGWQVGAMLAAPVAGAVLLRARVRGSRLAWALVVVASLLTWLVCFHLEFAPETRHTRPFLHNDGVAVAAAAVAACYLAVLGLWVSRDCSPRWWPFMVYALVAAAFETMATVLAWLYLRGTHVFDDGYRSAFLFYLLPGAYGLLWALVPAVHLLRRPARPDS